MATLSIKESREFVIFQAFSQNDSYNAALDALENMTGKTPTAGFCVGGREKSHARQLPDV